MDPLGNLATWIAVHGVFGLFLIALAERFVLVVHSYALLMAVGATAAQDAWMLPGVFLTTTLGGVLGCAACYLAVGALGDAHAVRLAEGAGRLSGMSADRIEHCIASMRRNGTALAFSLQLVPTARLLAPTLAGVLKVRSPSFLAASAAGIAVWNGLFIGLGYGASRAFGEVNATALAIATLGCLLAAQAILFRIARRTQPAAAQGAAHHQAR